MALLLKCNAVFLHVPKTGGSWIKKVLYDNNLVKLEFSHAHADMERTLNFFGHYPGSYIKRSIKVKGAFKGQIDDAYKFCFVRNPLHWYESFWSYMNRRDWQYFTKDENPSRFKLKHDHWHPISAIEKMGNKDFNCFKLSICSNTFFKISMRC